jgi:lysozyme family protein
MAFSVETVRDMCWAFTASQETEELSLDPNDPGNYAPGGQFVGSKWGISARSYPKEDIRNMTFERARDIWQKDFWQPIQGDDLARAEFAGLALLMSDASFMSGPEVAITTLQATIGTYPDGRFGPHTWSALRATVAGETSWTLPTPNHCLLAEFTANRLHTEFAMANWKFAKEGWAHRLTRSLALAIAFPPPSQQPALPATASA